MNTINLNPHLPIFPLPVFLLPGGITRLRIFEQRYLKMIQIASKGIGFVITSNKTNSNKESIAETQDDEWGSWVDIINFDQGEDGVLEVDVKCKNLVQLLSIDKDKDNLHFGDVKISSHWSQSDIKAENIPLFHSLVSVFEQNPLLESLYKDEMTANTHWVIARWLEILPINAEVKTLFSKDNSFQTAQEFVHSVVLSNKK
jgi:Lon protease-like protein